MYWNLDHISVSQLYQLEEYDFLCYMELQKVMNAKPFFCKHKAKKLTTLTFGEVSKIKRVLIKPTLDGLQEVFTAVFGIKKIQYYNADVVDYFYGLNHIIKSIEEIVKREQKALKGKEDADLDAAGVDKLSRFGELSTLIEVGKKFGKSPEEIEQWKYSLVFSIIFYGKIENEVKDNYSQIKMKNGTKG